MKTSTTLLLGIIIIGGLYYLYLTPSALPPVSDTASSTSTTIATTSPSVEDYVRQNISALSPEKAVLGGNFYVTNIEAHGGAGTVNYEDGHVAFIADFTYTIDPNGKVTIISFTPRK